MSSLKCRIGQLHHSSDITNYDWQQAQAEDIDETAEEEADAAEEDTLRIVVTAHTYGRKHY